MHDDATAVALLAAAERIVEADGFAALSLRKLAEATSTTTRAVYSLFGNKEGVIVALARRAFELLGADVHALPTTADSAGDLVEAGMIFRRFALDHPSLFRLAVQQTLAPAALAARSRPAAADAMRELRARVARLEASGTLGARSVDTAACEFHALCEGLAAVELRDALSADPERVWRDALHALVNGFAIKRSSPAARRTRADTSRR
jgi:AcrR family transcriptional regulator